MKKPKAERRSLEDRGTTFFWWEESTLVINILGKPSARRDYIGKPKGHQLKVSVTAAPKLAEQPIIWCDFLPGNWRIAIGDNGRLRPHERQQTAEN